MNILIRQCKRLFYGIALSVYATTPVLAADIEIFTDSNSASSTAQPNVMFLMDSSDTVRSTDLGSGAPVVASYDSTVTYPTVNSFDVSRLYYKDDGVAPTTHNDSQTFNASAYQCDHAIVDYQLNDITTGYLTSSSVSTPSKFVVDFVMVKGEILECAQPMIILRQQISVMMLSLRMKHYRRQRVRIRCWAL